MMAAAGTKPASGDGGGSDSDAEFKFATDDGSAVAHNTTMKMNTLLKLVPKGNMGDIVTKRHMLARVQCGPAVFFSMYASTLTEEKKHMFAFGLVYPVLPKDTYSTAMAYLGEKDVSQVPVIVIPPNKDVDMKIWDTLKLPDTDKVFLATKDGPVGKDAKAVRWNKFAWQVHQTLAVSNCKLINTVLLPDKPEGTRTLDDAQSELRSNLTACRPKDINFVLLGKTKNVFVLANENGTFRIKVHP